MPRPHRLFLPYCRCFSRHSPCRQERCILSKKPSDSQLRGSQRQRWNRRYYPAWSAHRAAARRCSPPAHGFYNPSRTHTAAHCAGWRPSGPQGAVRICFGLLSRVKFILGKGKGLGIVLLCICCNGCGVQTNERRIHHAQLIQLLLLCRHDFFQCSVILFWGKRPYVQ